MSRGKRQWVRGKPKELLVPARIDILLAVGRLYQRLGYPPIAAEIGREVYLSESTVRYHLRIMLRAGLLRRTEGLRKGVMVAANGAE